MKASPLLLDLFCGAGGLTLGAHQAGFTTKIAIDIDHDLTSSFSQNFPSVKQLHLDLSSVSPSAVAVLAGQVDGVVGGPPCQGFSDAGRGSVSDPRNRLVVRFMEIVAAVEPKFFFMENVPGLSFSRHSALLEEAMTILPIPYETIGPIVLNAADYGAATNRRRLVFAGYDPDLVAAFSEADLLGATKRGKPPSVQDAIADIPYPSDGRGPLPYRFVANLSPYAKRLRSAPPAGLSCVNARLRIKNGLVSGVEGTKHSDDVVERFTSVSPGSRDRISRYPKLDWNQPAPVLRAGTGREHGSFQAPRPIHPEEARVITVREAARLQGFPDWFEFSPTKWHSHRMIGNSVSPIFARRLLEVIKDRIK